MVDAWGEELSIGDLVYYPVGNKLKYSEIQGMVRPELFVILNRNVWRYAKDVIKVSGKMLLKYKLGKFDGI